MIEVKNGTDSLADKIIDLPGLRIGIRELSLLGGELYLWVEKTGKVTPSTLLFARKLFARYRGRCLANVDSGNPVAVRFAEFFGFRTVTQQYNILIMERN